MTDNNNKEKQTEQLIDKLIAVVSKEELDVSILSLVAVLGEAVRLDYVNNGVVPATTWMTVSDVLNELSLDLTGEAVDVTAKLIATQEAEGATSH